MFAWMMYGGLVSQPSWYYSVEFAHIGFLVRIYRTESLVIELSTIQINSKISVIPFADSSTFEIIAF